MSVHINPVHALLALLRQQASAEAQVKPPRQKLEDVQSLLTISKDTQFRLAMLERLVQDHLPGLERAGPPPPAPGPEALPGAALKASGRLADAINQSEPQNHGSAWHKQTGMWSELPRDDFTYQVARNFQAPQDPAAHLAQKFTPSVEDISEALFREDAAPTDFAKQLLARARLDEPTGQGPALWPRLLPFLIGISLLVWIASWVF